MALRVYEQLEGGRSAILRPGNRRRLVQIARTLGLRPFDANLVIAVVQDAARRGETPANAEPIASLAMVPAAGAGERAPERRSASWVFVVALVSAMLLGTLAAASTIVWLKGG